MKLTRLISLLLCLVLALGLAACDSVEPAPSTTATQPPATTVPTEPPLDPLALYADAVAAQEARPAYTLTITRVKTVELAAETFTENYKHTVHRSGDLLTAAATINYSNTPVFTKEFWADGTAYLDVNGSLYRSEMTLDAYLARYAPVALFTPENYASVTAEEGESIVITFAEAAAPESWLAPEDLTLVSATGTATLTGEGQLTGCAYDLTYSYGGVTVTEDWDITYDTVKAEPKVPAEPDGYLQIESLDAPLLLEQGKAHLAAAKTVNSTSSQLITSQAAAYGCEMHLQLDITDGMYRFFNRLTEMSSSGTQSYTLDELYRDGKYTMSVDGEEPEEVEGVSTKVLDVYVQQQLLDPIHGADSIATAAVTDLGSVLLAECTGNDAWGDAVRALVCGTILADPYALDDLSTATSNITTDFYIALDKYTGLPTAYGYNYEGTHTIQNGLYVLAGQHDIAYDVGSLEAYENITEEPAPDAEAESPTPLLYKVTGENGQQMWLFGTIHVGDDRTGYLPQELVDALVSADALALECDIDGFEAKLDKDAKLAQKVSEAYYYSDGTTAEEHFLDSELYPKVLQLVKATGGYSYMTEMMKPELWSSSIENFFLRQGHRLTSQKGLEARLTKIAQENDIPLREVESVLFQIQMTDSWSQELVELMLRDLTEVNGVGYALETHDLYDRWCAGDEADLIEAVKDDTSEMTEEELALYEEYNKSISSDRNAGMLEVAKEYLESGDTVFFAVGLAHLLAEDGLVFTLRDAGYTVELITYG